ncbi:MAG: cytochrome c-type biogenesis protein CcmH [Candidatus Rokubacteria bacterium]|nr:cytochrome c-type biogenesis protein CcmH [Candidatus Rokubacteria bacterium]
MTTARSGSEKRKFRRLLEAGLLGLWLAMPALLLAQQDLDEQVRSIAAQLRCPVCQNLSVADSPSEMAREMRDVIREQLRAGKTPEEIKAYFLSKYGDWILLSPRPRGLSLLVWIGPFAAAAVGIAVAVRAVRRWTRRSGVRERPAPDPALLERVRWEAFDAHADAGPKDPEHLSPIELERENLYVALREFEFDYRSGKLSEADYEAMRDDYEARAAQVLAELDRIRRSPRPSPQASAPPRPAARQAAEQTVRPRRTWRLVSAGAFLLVLGLSLGYFLSQSLRPRMGEQDTLTGDFLTGTGPGGIAPGSRGPAENVARLLASGRAAYERQDWRAAIDAFKQALVLDPGNPEAHTSLGLILLRAGHGDEALLAVERALTTNPTYPFALWAKGVVLFEVKQDYVGAINAWETLMAQTLAPADADQVARMITEARTRLAVGPASARQVATSRGTITGTVALAPSLRTRVPAGGVLFIIAKRGDGPPLAAKRIPSPVFPVEFSLGPEDRMIRGTPFEGEVMLLARVKRDGKAGPPGPGDLEGEAKAPVRVGQRGVEVVLDKTY